MEREDQTMDHIQAPFRRAVAEDAGALAELVNFASEGLAFHVWDRIKEAGETPWDIGRRRAAREEGAFSYRNAVVAEIGGEGAACLVGYRLDDPYDVDGSLAETPEIVRPLVRLEAKAPGSWYVNVLATFPEFRRKGIGARLLAIAEEKAREERAPALSVIVAGWNEPAARLYARAGYSTLAREPALPFPGCPHEGDWVLMVKSLTGA